MLRLVGGDAADASWEIGRIRGMGFDAIIREVGDDYYKIYVRSDQVDDYRKADRDEQEEYWRSPQGIEEQKYLGKMERDFIRSPRGRFEKNRDRRFNRLIKSKDFRDKMDKGW